MKVSLNQSKGKILSTYKEVEKTLREAYTSHKLTSGTLKENDRKTYELRLWLDEKTPAKEEVMEATIKSKITLKVVHQEDVENDLKEENISLNETYSNKEETIEFIGISRDYDIIEYSEDDVIYHPLENPGKEVRIKNTYKVAGTYTMYMKDEVGNITQSTVETTKLDQVDPEVSFTVEEYLDGLRIDASKSSDSKSGIKKYFYKIGEGEFIESKESTYVFSGLTDGTYQVTVKVEDLAGNFSEEKEKSILYRSIYEEKVLKESIPVLKNELIPVTIENNGVVKKADLRTEWYSYTQKQWANAIILKNESITYKEKEVIPEDNIESYFVWIPKYRYQLWDLENYNGVSEIDSNKKHTISLIFGDYNTDDSKSGECMTPMTSGNNGSCKVGDYMTHPAFLSISSTGFWVGKFEPSKSNNAEDNSRNGAGVQIKPNVVSWRNINVSNAFYTCYDYKRNLDSHMIKNTEWGAVAYLQHSEYGSQASVRINNNSNYLTGYASVKEPTCGLTNDNRACNQYGTTSDVTLPYNTSTGYLASTTGNISGIYDVSGGSWEYTMGVMTGQNGNPLSGKNASLNSGFIGGYGSGSGNKTTGYFFPDLKYYDKYSYGTSTLEYVKGILGDATKEMGPFKQLVYANSYQRWISSWHVDHAVTVNNEETWMVRGSVMHQGSDSGMFAFGARDGSAYYNFSFRVVLTPQK